jgi:hypothetical protein
LFVDTISSLFTTSSLGAVFEVNAAAASSAQLTINSGGKRTSRRGSRRNRSARKSRSFGQESAACGCNSDARKSLRKSMRKSIHKSVSCRKGKCSSARRSAIRRSLLKAVRSTSRKAAAIKAKSASRKAKKSASRKAKKSASPKAKKSSSRKAAKSITPCRQRKSPCAAKVSPCAASKAVAPAAAKKLAAVQQISAQSNGNIPADVRERIAARVQHHLENRKHSPEEVSKRRLWCALQRGDCRAREVVVDIFKGANSCKPVVCKPCAPCQDRPCPKFAPCPTAAKCPPVKPCAPCPTQSCPKDGPCPPCAPPPNCPPCALQNMFRGK